MQLIIKKHDSFDCKHKWTGEAKTIATKLCNEATATKPLQQRYCNRAFITKPLQPNYCHEPIAIKPL